MPTIIIQANPECGEHARITLTERIVAASLESSHYGAQLIERLAWAIADAEAIESEPTPTSPPRPRRTGQLTELQAASQNSSS